LIFCIAVLGCIALVLMEISSNIAAESEEQRDAASTALPTDRPESGRK
jgi:hypothetical protein